MNEGELCNKCHNKKFLLQLYFQLGGREIERESLFTISRNNGNIAGEILPRVGVASLEQNRREPGCLANDSINK